MKKIFFLVSLVFLAPISPFAFSMKGSGADSEMSDLAKPGVLFNPLGALGAATSGNNPITVNSPDDTASTGPSQEELNPIPVRVGTALYLLGLVSMTALGAYYLSNEWQCPVTLNGTAMNPQCCGPNNNCNPATDSFDCPNRGLRYCELDNKKIPANYDSRNRETGTMLLVPGVVVLVTSIIPLMAIHCCNKPAGVCGLISSLFAGVGFSVVAYLSTHTIWECLGGVSNNIYTRCCDLHNASVCSPKTLGFNFEKCQYGQIPHCVSLDSSATSEVRSTTYMSSHPGILFATLLLGVISCSAVFAGTMFSCERRKTASDTH